MCFDTTMYFLTLAFIKKSVNDKQLLEKEWKNYQA